ncbi:MAG: hypothetical protein GY757_32130, partial [bacterium]|nr:hypothetical protein [bacterium]
TSIAEHHDALRIVYTDGKKNRGITQENRPVSEPLYRLETFDFTTGETRDTLTAEEEQKIKKTATLIQGAIDLKKGPLLQAAIFKTAAGDHLMLAVHHLVVDGISWRIVLEDMAAGYKQALAGEPIRFPEKTNSFKEWMEKLTAYAQSPELLAEIPHWKSIENSDVPRGVGQTLRGPLRGERQGQAALGTPIALRAESGEKNRKRKYLKNVSVSFNERETRSLLTEVNKPYNTGVNDILLAGLAAALYRWTGNTGHSVNLEGHGREPVVPGVTTARTVGWFTAFYPVILPQAAPENISLLIREVKENLHHTPNNGIGYGILRYLTPGKKKEGLTFKHKPEISFNYLGQ